MVGIGKALMDKGGPDFLVDHVEHQHQCGNIVILFGGFKAIEKVALGHFQEHFLDAFDPEIVLVGHMHCV